MLRGNQLRKFSTSKLEEIFGKKLVGWATEGTVYTVPNFIKGRWVDTTGTPNQKTFPNPLTGKPSFAIAELTPNDIHSIKEDMENCPKSGLFNPLKNPSMYRKWGEILFRAAHFLHDPEVEGFMLKVMNLCVPKSKSEAYKELLVSRQGLENFSGDNPRFTLRGFVVSGDREGQETVGYRFPYGPSAIITPFNFPMEIPTLQLMGALFSGNKTLVKPDTRGAPVVEALVRLFQAAGMPPESLVLVNGDRECAEKVFESCKDTFRIVQFTGSSRVAHKLLEQFKGKVKIEDSGFNWKILGPDVHLPEYVVSQADQDAFATSGQKCSCMRILLVHKNWGQAGFLDKLVARVKQRKLADLTISPILSVSNEQIEERVAELSKIPGAKILVGGRRVTESHNVPSIYGLFEPTIISLPFSEVSKKENSQLIFKELFGPLLIVTEYDTPELKKVIDITEEIPFHLTAAVVSNDPAFVNYVTKNTVNGVTYVGVKARTTGAPQNHFFGPSNDPRGAGIGTPEAIINTWTCHREVIYDYGTFSDKPDALSQS